jgi:hypothetical protein
MKRLVMVVGRVKLLRDPTSLAPLVECWVALKRLTQPTNGGLP